MSRALILANALSTFYLLGLIFTIQFVHYPLFSQVGEAAFVDYEAAHVLRITFIVAPPMLVELVTAVLLVLKPPEKSPRALFIVGLVLVGIVWLSTLVLQIPAHDILSQGFDVEAHSSLVATNFIRTASWALRALLMGGLLWRCLNLGTR